MRVGTSADPILIIGAARSGTKLLRSLLASPEGIAEIPYDINFVWRYGNDGLPHDEIRPSCARPEVRRFIRRYFERRTDRGRVRLVEKTVSNALRLPFCMEIFPTSKVVFLVRDGRDVVESALRMWQAPLDPGHVLRKLRSFPLAATPAYAWRYLRVYLDRRLGGDGHVASWGPRFDGIDDLVRSYPLIDVCARQWQVCVDRAEEAFLDLTPGQGVRVQYERLVRDPRQTLDELFAFLEIGASTADVDRAAEQVHRSSIGKGHSRLEPEQLQRLEAILGPTLERIGYAQQWPTHYNQHQIGE